MNDNRVAITAVGLVSPLGMDSATSWENLKASRTGIGHFPRENLPSTYQYLGQVNDPCDVPDDISRQLTSQIRFLNRGSLLGLSAARQAFLSSGLGDTTIPPDRRTLYIGSGDFTNVGYEFMYPAMKAAADSHWQQVDQARLNQAAIDLVNPFFLLESLSNNLFSFLSAYLQFMGSGTSLAAQSPGGSNAVELAYRSIKQGRADIALAVGCGNWNSDVPLYEMRGLGLLSECRQGADSYRPLSKTRDGFIPGEGGAALLLESLESARSRGAEILGLVGGVGNTLSPDPENGLGFSLDAYRAAFNSALDESGRQPADLGFVIAHGSGTRKGDGTELEALETLLGGSTTSPGIAALKAQTGHMAAASDVAEIIFGLMSLGESMVPGTHNFNGTENKYSHLPISASPQTFSHRNFVSMSIGVGGQVSSVAVEAP
ncbi:MAG: hypothetical protein GY703_04155 [Gammaproteobacteria bacterium]|nr:hypothetical protein [Gammaproteobacteria bacterium]